MNRQVYRLTRSRVDDFYKLHSVKNGCGWCFCVAWWVESWDGWGDRTAEQNRNLRDRLFQKGNFDGYLLYDGNNPVGWCQVGPRDRLIKLVRQFGLSPSPNTWAITCFLILPEYRRQGNANFLLSEVVRDLRKRGIKYLESFPKRGLGLDELDLWNGPEQIFIQSGFLLVQDHPQRPILRLEI